MYGQGADSWKDTERDAAEGSEDIRPGLDVRGSRPKARGRGRRSEDGIEGQKTEVRGRQAGYTAREEAGGGTEYTGESREIIAN